MLCYRPAAVSSARTTVSAGKFVFGADTRAPHVTTDPPQRGVGEREGRYLLMRATYLSRPEEVWFRELFLLLLFFKYNFSILYPRNELK